MVLIYLFSLDPRKKESKGGKHIVAHEIVAHYHNSFQICETNIEVITIDLVYLLCLKKDYRFQVEGTFIILI